MSAAVVCALPGCRARVAQPGECCTGCIDACGEFLNRVDERGMVCKHHHDLLLASQDCSCEAAHKVAAEEIVRALNLADE